MAIKYWIENRDGRITKRGTCANDSAMQEIIDTEFKKSEAYTCIFEIVKPDEKLVQKPKPKPKPKDRRINNEQR